MCTGKNVELGISIRYPSEGTLFPADLASPKITWVDSTKKAHQWTVIIGCNGDTLLRETTDSTQFSPDSVSWARILSTGKGKAIQIRIEGVGRGPFAHTVSAASIGIGISTDLVEAPIFYRAVTLPFSFARQNLKSIRWHLGYISDYRPAQTVLQNNPICANCHSFSADGKTLAMDVDARGDKGAYVIAPFESRIHITQDNIITWSNFQNKPTYGLLSQISPDGRYIISTLRDSEVFIDRDNLEYSQLFFPLKGILVVYDRKTKKMRPLPGADDTMMVQSNPCWSPDGKTIYFVRTWAIHEKESGVRYSSQRSSDSLFNAMIAKFTSGQKEFKFDIYTIPFNEGNGGKAVPLKGASNNGMSNFFPRVSPDGKWLVFTQARNFMLLQRDSRLWIMPASGGVPRKLDCNFENMNSWHSWSPNSKWLVFSSKQNGPYTQLYLTHIGPDGRDSPPVRLDHLSFADRAANIPEFVNITENKQVTITPDVINEDVTYYNRIGLEKFAEKNITGAIEAFTTAISLNNTDYHAFYNKGVVYFKTGDFSKALEDFSMSISLNDTNSQAFYSRGQIYLKTGEYRKAVDDFSKAINWRENYYEAYEGRALSRYKLNDTTGAVADFKKCVAIKPNSASAHYLLGLIKIELQKDLQGCDDLKKAFSLGDTQSAAAIQRYCK